jgi:hypothetical protein
MLFNHALVFIRRRKNYLRSRATTAKSALISAGVRSSTALSGIQLKCSLLDKKWMSTMLDSRKFSVYEDIVVSTSHVIFTVVSSLKYVVTTVDKYCFKDIIKYCHRIDNQVGVVYVTFNSIRRYKADNLTHPSQKR